jgi:hypothetical protein
MNADKVAAIAGSIVTVALVTTVLMRGTQAGQVIRAIGDAFSQSIRTAQGR